MRPQVKVCGITSAQDARLAVDLGAAYLGLNFYPGSPRHVSIERAQEIAEAVEGCALLVGVFVNAPCSQVSEIAEAAGLDLLQFHGNESPEMLAPFAARAIKAFRGSTDEAERFPDVQGFLFDAPNPALSFFPSPELLPFGGTGTAWDYASLAPIVSRFAPRPIFVAGGIGPDNVRSALCQSGASLVDVCSRVERAPGVKDSDLLSRLFSEIATYEEPHVP
ncbi:MAG TPA: phosphoribosylanthranilate isomerase [Thermoanaerobaculia bacterium]|jgi:phosphoribosylanthranilate isomerase|nr:phosphoribosylanthranilate isomerase [Thermoanaerobaculia bacterium]